ncbi:YkyA family protein [Psychrobacillus sp. OK032]|uniref:YkyA family protein n=1 Tax=Psychrobacillus sp. OK032 TaxID=1884358 RepID=UPI0008C8E023|nr:YkyA family protein [Psychrobacillus sp. OK032]SER59694.1 Putative cell-wall binding lipoprotein [Psychrobacillus sp. OK032]
MKKWKYVIPLCFVLLLSACSFGQTTEDKLSNILTEIYNLEADYRDVQTQLAETEQKEQANFQSMMELTKDQKEELTKQVEETAQLLEERLVLVEKEAASIKSASEKLTDIDALISESDEASEKESIQKIEEALKNRYTAYSDLTEQYNALASLQEKLYKMLIHEAAEVTTIQAQVDEVNKQNEVVQQSVETFNELTAELNKIKEEVFTSLQKEN